MVVCSIMKLLYFLFLTQVFLRRLVYGHLPWRPPNNEAIDQSIYENALDSELCSEQMQYVISDSALSMQFLEAGLRIPKGILQGNTVEFGNYHFCLGINEPVESSIIQGKYCMIRVPFNQNIAGSGILEQFDPSHLKINEDTKNKLRNFKAFSAGARALSGVVDNSRSFPGNPLLETDFSLALCVPKPCTTKEFLENLSNITGVGFQYEDQFCRLPDDKPYAPADFVMMAVVSVIGFLTLFSTCYDLYKKFFIDKDSRKVNKILQSFSVYTNGRRLMNFSSGPGNLDCLDGVRALAMVWVVVGHCFSNAPVWINPIEGFQWVTTWEALWLTSGHVTVDTFFLLSGILVVYTTASKMTGIQLLKNLHVFYLNRLLRMFPILALTILFEASYINHMTDGPDWSYITTRHVNSCRVFWWSTLLHIQNYMNPADTCIGQSWYLAIDVQLHMLSPLILFWILTRKRALAWGALVLGFLGIMIASTLYNFYMEFPSGMMNPNRTDELMYYLVYYYVNTLTRAPVFIVGMFFGYLLHLWRDKDVDLSKIAVIILWIVAMFLTTFVMYSTYPILQWDWDNQTLDSVYNSFIRILWGTGLGMMIFACVQGYGGPINWFLSLTIWKLPARVSYAMYLFHYVLLSGVNAAVVQTVYFSVDYVVYTFLAHFVFIFVVSFLVTLIVDAPFQTLFKILLDKAAKKSPRKHVTEETMFRENEKQM